MGRSSIRDDVRCNEVILNGGKINIKRNRDLLDRRIINERHRCATRIFYDSDDSSSSSIPSPMTFHNYAKRQRFSVTENEAENYIRYLIQIDYFGCLFLSIYLSF